MAAPIVFLFMSTAHYSARAQDNHLQVCAGTTYEGNTMPLKPIAPYRCKIDYYNKPYNEAFAKLLLKFITEMSSQTIETEKGEALTERVWLAKHQLPGLRTVVHVASNGDVVVDARFSNIVEIDNPTKAFAEFAEFMRAQLERIHETGNDVWDWSEHSELDDAGNPFRQVLAVNDGLRVAVGMLSSPEAMSADKSIPFLWLYEIIISSTVGR